MADINSKITGYGDFKSPCGDVEGDFILRVCKAYHFSDIDSDRHHVNDNTTFRHRFVRARKVKSPSMGGEGDSNHLVSGGDLEGDSDFTQPSFPVQAYFRPFTS